MARTERVTVTIDRETLLAIRRIAGPRGVSSFLAVAADERLARLRNQDVGAAGGGPGGAIVRAVPRPFGAKRKPGKDGVQLRPDFGELPIEQRRAFGMR